MPTLLPIPSRRSLAPPPYRRVSASHRQKIWPRRSVLAMGEAEWEQEAENWLRWARTPGHDAYWYYRDSFLDSIVPPPARRTLEIGCGEGRVARDLADRGHRVTALDTSKALVRHARQADFVGDYLASKGAALPFTRGCFDIVVAYNALQVVADMPGTVEEAARVLVPSGYLCFCVAHPTTDLGHFLSDEHNAPYTIRSAYFERTRVEDTVERDGLAMTFRGWTYTLEDYASTLAHSGFTIEAIREPKPDPSAGRYERWTRVPLFMNVRALKR
jgi:SAM-dependent methyltransferase